MLVSHLRPGPPELGNRDPNSLVGKHRVDPSLERGPIAHQTGAMAQEHSKIAHLARR